MKQIIKNSQGFFALLAAAIVFATFGVWIRELDKMFNDYAQVGFRSGLATLFIIVYIIYTRTKVSIPRDKILHLVIFSFAFPLTVIFFTLSVNEIKAANTVFMLYIGSMVTAFVLGTLFHKEKVTRKKILAQVFVLIGLYVFIYPLNSDTLEIGVIFALLAGFFDGLANALRKSLGKINRQSVLVYQYGVGTVLGFALAFTASDPIVKEVSIGAILVGIIFAFCLVAIGNLLIYGFNHIDVNFGTVILATELFFALVINYFILSESPTKYEMLGGIIIFLAAILGNVDWGKLFGKSKS